MFQHEESVPATTDLMGAVGGLTMHEGRRTQAVLEGLTQQRVASITCTKENLSSNVHTIMNS